MSVFQYLDYKEYLKNRLSKGEKSLFAQAVGCSPSYFSQVLQGKPQLTPEQGVRANRFLSHSKVEAQYFMLILQRTRAATQELEDFFHEQILALRREQEKIRAHIGPTEEISDQAKAIYYSSWTYPALHMLLSLPGSSDIDFLAHKLGLARQELEKKITVLVTLGLVKKHKNSYELTQQRIHISTDSPHLTAYHTQSRVRAIDSVSRAQEGDLHFSSFICHSHADAAKIKAVIKECISRVEETYRPSKEEAVFAFNLDYFEV